MANKSKKILVNELKLASYAHNIFTGYIHDDTTLDDVLQPSYWAHVASNLKPFTTSIELFFTGGEGQVIPRYVRLAVLSVEQGQATVAVMYDQLLKSGYIVSAEDLKGDYSLKQQGTKKWAVIRNHDKFLVKTDLPTKMMADAWLGEFIKSMATVDEEQEPDAPDTEDEDDQEDEDNGDGEGDDAGTPDANKPPEDVKPKTPAKPAVPKAPAKTAAPKAPAKPAQKANNTQAVKAK